MAEINSTGFKITYKSEYHTNRAKLRKKYTHLSVGIDVLKHIICKVKLKRVPTRRDTIDFKTIAIRDIFCKCIMHYK